MTIGARTSQLRLLRIGFHAAAVSALAVAAALYYFLLLQPIEGRRQALWGETQKTQQVVEAAKRARKSHTQLRTDLAELQRRGAATRLRIPETAGENEFLALLTQAAQGAEVEIGDYQRHSVVQQETHSELRVRVKCEGTFAALCTLLNQLQGQPRLIAVESLNITSDLGTDRHAVDITFVLLFGLKSVAGKEDVAPGSVGTAHHGPPNISPHVQRQGVRHV